MAAKPLEHLGARAGGDCHLEPHFRWSQAKRQQASFMGSVEQPEVGALESALGLTLLQSEAVKAGFPTSAEADGSVGAERV